MTVVSKIAEKGKLIQNRSKTADALSQMEAFQDLVNEIITCPGDNGLRIISSIFELSERLFDFFPNFPEFFRLKKF